MIALRSVIEPVMVSTESRRNTAESGSASSVTTGAWVSRMTVRTESVAFPAASTAWIVTVFAPSVASGTLAVKLVLSAVPAATVAAWPFTVIVTVVWSFTTPTASTSVLFVMSPFAGAVTVMVGGAASVAAAHSVSREPGVPWSCT